VTKTRAHAIPWLARAGVEALLIVFAVVLGFVVNEWRADVRADREARTALSRVAQEMQSNTDMLRTVSEYHQDTVGRIDALIARIDSGEVAERGVLLDRIPEFLPRGMQEPQLSRIAWDYAEQRGDMDPLAYELVSELARIYTTQEAGVESTWRMIVQRFFGQIETVSEAELRPRLVLMRFAFRELASQESHLIYLYEAALPNVDAAASD